MGYNFYNNKEEIKYLNESWEYDTLSYYKFCAFDLYEINQRIKNGEIIKIVKNEGTTTEKTYLVENTTDFKNWVEKIFKGGFEKHLETIMK
jgi:hypothetical protein